MSCELHFNEVAVVVAHPDDETLWAGGTILTHPNWHWNVFALCRASDPDRSPKFMRALEYFGARGDIADLDDGPDQNPLSDEEVLTAVHNFLGGTQFDLIITHGPWGEYTRHLRHEETCQAVATLWQEGRIRTRELWLFAYEDDGGTRLPRAIRDAHQKFSLRSSVWKEKYHIITGIYGFSPESWEARTTPYWEAFWRFRSPERYLRWYSKESKGK